MNIIDKYIDDIKQQNNAVEFGYQFHTDNTLSKSSKLLASQHILSESMNKSNVKQVALTNNYPNLNEEQNASIHEAYSKPANTYSVEYENLNNNNKTDKSIKPLEYAYEIRGHENKVITLALLSSGKLASGSYDKTIRIWNIQQYITEKTLIEDGTVLSLLEFEPDKLLSGTNVNTINLWSLGDYRKMFTFNGHILWVNCLVKLTNILFASCSNDSIINIWNFNTLQKVYTLEEHNDCVLTMIKLNNGELCSGSADNSIKIWNWKQESCVHTLEGHKQWVKCLCELNNGDILSGSDDKTIKVWRDLKCLMTLEGHESPVRALFKMNERYFLSGSFDNSIRVWEVNGDVIECTQIEKRHQDNVITIIKGNGNKIFSSSNDCSIIEWKWKCN
jgi:WD40 repeat protein